MTLRTLVKKMDDAYYHEGMLVEIFDHPRHNGFGDGLAEFIVSETKDMVAYEKKLTNKDIKAIKRALELGRKELGRVIASLPA